MNARATATYIETANQIIDILDRIKDIVENSEPQDNIDWAHVGELNYVYSRLNDAKVFLQGEGR